jgi:hypothetical protein
MHLDVGRIWSGGDRRRQFVGALLVGMAIVLSLAPAAAPAAAQDARPAAALAEDLVERFEVLPLSRGIVLRPRFGGGYRAVEIAAGGAAVDGDKVSLQELGERVTDEEDLALIQELLALSARGRRDVLLAVENVDAAAPRPPAPPAPPEVPEVAAAPEAPELPAVPEVPEAPEPPRSSHSDAEVAVGSHIVVEEGESSDDVVVFGGSITVEGEVEGDAVALGGSIEVNGPVSGDVVAVGGSVDLGPEADVGGEVVSVGGKVDKDPAARVAGKISEAAFGSGLRGLRALRHLERRGGDLEDHDEWDDWSFRPFDRASGLVWGLVKIGLLALLACLALMLARRSVERIGARAATETWRSGATGLVAQILFVPVLVITVVVLAVSIIGIPLLLLVPFALVGLVIAAFVGYSAVAHRLGRWIENRFGWAHRSDLQSLLIGVVTIEMWRVLARLLDWGPLGFVSFLVTAFGFLVAYLAWTVGFGAMLLTLFSEGGPLARRRARLAGTTSMVPPPASAAPIDPEPPAAEWIDEEPITPVGDLDPVDPTFDERDPEDRRD